MKWLIFIGVIGLMVVLVVDHIRWSRQAKRWLDQFDRDYLGKGIPPEGE